MTPAEMAALHGECFSVPRPWTETEFAEQLRLESTIPVFRAGGFLLGRAIAGEAEILTLAVCPNRRRQGLALQLVTEFLQEAGAQGAKRAFLEVVASNVAALALYSKAGFQPDGTRRDYYRCANGAREDAIVLSRDL